MDRTCEKQVTSELLTCSTHSTIFCSILARYFWFWDQFCVLTLPLFKCTCNNTSNLFRLSFLPVTIHHHIIWTCLVSRGTDTIGKVSKVLQKVVLVLVFFWRPSVVCASSSTCVVELSSNVSLAIKLITVEWSYVITCRICNVCKSYWATRTWCKLYW